MFSIQVGFSYFERMIEKPAEVTRANIDALITPPKDKKKHDKPSVTSTSKAVNKSTRSISKKKADH
jgi:hypothetical protein